MLSFVTASANSHRQDRLARVGEHVLGGPLEDFGRRGFGDRLPWKDDEVGVDGVGGIEDDVAGVARLTRLRKAVVDGGHERDVRLIRDDPDVREESLRILRDVVLLEGAGVHSLHDAPAEYVQGVDFRVVAVGDGDGALDGGGGLLAPVDRREYGVDGNRLTDHTRWCVPRHKKATPRPPARGAEPPVFKPSRL